MYNIKYKSFYSKAVKVSIELPIEWRLIEEKAGNAIFANPELESKNEQYSYLDIIVQDNPFKELNLEQSCDKIIENIQNKNILFSKKSLVDNYNSHTICFNYTENNVILLQHLTIAQIDKYLFIFSFEDFNQDKMIEIFDYSINSIRLIH